VLALATLIVTLAARALSGLPVAHSVNRARRFTTQAVSAGRTQVIPIDRRLSALSPELSKGTLAFRTSAAKPITQNRSSLGPLSGHRARWRLPSKDRRDKYDYAQHQGDPQRYKGDNDDCNDYRSESFHYSPNRD
jgi:hypothetical protein